MQFKTEPVAWKWQFHTMFVFSCIEIKHNPSCITLRYLPPSQPSTIAIIHCFGKLAGGNNVKIFMYFTFHSFDWFICLFLVSVFFTIHISTIPTLFPHLFFPPGVGTICYFKFLALTTLPTHQQDLFCHMNPCWWFLSAHYTSMQSQSLHEQL